MKYSKETAKAMEKALEHKKGKKHLKHEKKESKEEERKEHESGREKKD